MKMWSRTAVVVGLLVFGVTMLGAQGAMAQLNAKQLIERNGCLMCHSLNGKGGKMGPPMQSIAAWADADRIFNYILNPKTTNPKSMMRPSRMNAEEIQAITDLIMSYKDTAKAPKGWKAKK
jgi:cytochrome c551/c552